MHKKLWMAFVAMAALTALMAGLLVGCSVTVKHEIDQPQKSPENNNTTSDTEEMVTVIVTIGDGTDETMVVGGGVDERPVDVQNPEKDDPTKPTTGKNPTTPTTPENPKNPNTPTTPAGPNLALTFEEYLNMTGAQQEAHYDSFGSISAFVAWFDAAKAEWQEQNQGIEVTGPDVNLDDYIKP